MGMDIDYIAAKQAIEKLDTLLSNSPHGKRSKIADDIIRFVGKMESKWPVKK